ncbi:MAG TPA: 3-isopropylmalate dehydratase small subunit [Vicinamibacterales bacterium]|nr:3-isopropylmalate dehydratase small subunit [Vicinamibacterales bacterium]
MKPIVRIEGRGLPLPGANIDTDRIIPARFLRTVTFDGLEQHAFEDDRAACASRGEIHPFDDPRFAGAAVLVVNNNFGCGSSREHAPQALHRRGVRAVIGESFSEIFFGNAVMLGMPCVTAAAEDVSRLQGIVMAAPDAVLSVDLAQSACGIAGEAAPYGRIAIHLPPSAREALLSGAWDATALLLADAEAIDRTAAALPYLRW